MASSAVLLFSLLLLPLLVPSYGNAEGGGAQDGTSEPQLEIELPDRPADEGVHVGDRVPVRVKARSGSGWMWGELRVMVGPGEPWAVLDGPTELAGSQPPVWDVALMPLELGELDLPPLEVTARAEDGSTRKLAPVDKPTVQVSSVLEEETEGEAEPVAMRPPLGVTGLPWEWALPGLLMALPIAGLAAWFMGRRRVAGAAGSGPSLAPLAELEQLLKDLGERVGREPAEGLCDGLARGVRHYLERRSGEPALEMTSFELRLLARRLSWPEPFQRSVQSVMGVADGVRYGRRSIGESLLRRALDEAFSAGQALEVHLAPDPEARAQDAKDGGDRSIRRSGGPAGGRAT